jgi:hypothetical protein
MSAELFEAALEIAPPPWSVQAVEFDESAKRLTVLIDFKPGTHFAVSGHAGEHPVHDTVVKTYRHLNFGVGLGFKRADLRRFVDRLLLQLQPADAEHAQVQHRSNGPTLVPQRLARRLLASKVMPLVRRGSVADPFTAKRRFARLSHDTGSDVARLSTSSPLGEGPCEGGVNVHGWNVK